MNIFKRLFSLLSIVLLLLATSCSNGNSELQKYVDEINNRCPVSAGEFGSVTGARLDGDNVILTMLINEDFFNIEALQNNGDMLKNSVMQMLSNPTDDMQLMIDFMKKNGGSISYEYIGDSSDTKVSVTVSNDELKAIDKDDADPVAALDAQIQMTNLHFPMQVDEVTLAVNITREGNNVVYLYEINEQLYDMSSIDQYRDAIQNNLLESLRAQRDDISLRVFLNTCRKANCDIVYRYKGNHSGITYDFKIPIDDIFSN